MHERVLLSADAGETLNSQFRKVLHLVQRVPMLSQTQGPSTHVCLLSLVDLTGKFQQKLQIKKQLEVQEVTMFNATHTGRSRGFDIRKPRGSFEDGGLAATLKHHEEDSFAKVISRLETKKGSHQDGDAGTQTEGPDLHELTQKTVTQGDQHTNALSPSEMLESYR